MRTDNRGLVRSVIVGGGFTGRWKGRVFACKVFLHLAGLLVLIFLNVNATQRNTIPTNMADPRTPDLLAARKQHLSTMTNTALTRRIALDLPPPPPKLETVGMWSLRGPGAALGMCSFGEEMVRDEADGVGDSDLGCCDWDSGFVGGGLGC